MTDHHLLNPEQLAGIQRLKWLATTAGIVGAGLSTTANIMASEQTAGAILFAAIAPAAFAITAEMFTTAAGLPSNRLMKTGTWVMAAVALSAAVVSFGHIRSVVLSFGESPLSAVLIPLVIDAMVLLGLAYHHGAADMLRRHEHATSDKEELAVEADTKPSTAEQEQLPVADEPEIGLGPLPGLLSLLEPAADPAPAETIAAKAPKAKPVPKASKGPSVEEIKAYVQGPGAAKTRSEQAAQLGVSDRTIRRALQSDEHTEEAA